ncbi:MAG: sulfite exporter TauE/SafE family protein [Gammaproteobacteria bacterium]
MPAELNHLAAFVIGVFSTLHCWGMCGGIIGALSLSVPENIRRDRFRQGLMTLGYNLGRIGSYTLAGVFTATLGFVFSSATGHVGHLVLQTLSGVILIFLGLYLGGWFSGMNIIERAGMRVWARLQPVGKLFLPPDRFYKAIIVGAVWGWIPCGLVYSVLLWSAASADPLRGGTYMLAFGLGTLPGMLAAGLAAGRLLTWKHLGLFRKAAGAAVILFGVFILISPHLSGNHQESSPRIHQHE